MTDKPLRLKIDRDWCLRMAEREEGEIGAGFELTDASQLRPYLHAKPIDLPRWPFNRVDLTELHDDRCAVRKGFPCNCASAAFRPADWASDDAEAAFAEPSLWSRFVRWWQRR